ERGSRGAREPHRGDPLMGEGGGELVQARDTLAADGDEGIDGDEENAGGLAQTKLRNGEDILSEFHGQAVLGEKKKAGKRICPPLMCPATVAGHFALCLVARLCCG